MSTTKRWMATSLAAVLILCSSGRTLRSQQKFAGDDADQPIKTAVQNPNAVALIIGISDYQDSDIPHVTYAVNDAEAVQRVLTETLGYAGSNVLLRTNAQVSAGRLKTLVQQTLAGKVRPGQSDVFFYFSGHGAPNANTKEGYLIPWDFDTQFEPTGLNAYALKELYADLGKMGARSVTVILESCFSGQSEGGPLTKAASPLSIEVNNPAQALANSVVITASGGREIASWHPDKPHGLMTYYWLRAMRGEAGDPQGRLTPTLLKRYLQEKVASVAKAAKGRNQTPEIVAFQPDRTLAELPVSALRSGVARLVERSGGLEVAIDVGGDLTIDGIVQGAIPPGQAFLIEKFPAGPHRVEVRKTGYDPIRDDIVIVPNETLRKTYRLVINLPTAGRLDRSYGLIEVSVDRGGTLFLDEKQTADLPPFGRYTTPRIDAGPHHIRIEKPGFAVINQEVMVRPNETAKLELSLTPIPSSPTTGRGSRGSDTVTDPIQPAGARGLRGGSNQPAETPEQIYQLGVNLATGKGVAQNDAEAVKYFRMATDSNHVKAQTYLGYMYETGRGGLPKSDTDAVAWYRKAADQGYATAQSNLGVMYEYGRGGLPKSDTDAVAWYRKGADQGDAIAQNHMGVMSENGRGGLPKSDADAAAWYRKAADQGDARAQGNLGVLHEYGRGGLTRSDVDAVAWYRKAADQGNARAQTNIGYFYENGRGGLTKSDADAVAWYRKAADQGDLTAQVNLGFMYANGRGGLTKSDADAVAWYRKAADQGSGMAHNNLGFMYETGRGGLTKNNTEAARLYRIAAEKGISLAQANLAIMYENGTGVPKDFVEAYAWNVLAIEGNKDSKAASDGVARLAKQLAPGELAQAINRVKVLRAQIHP